MATEGFSEESFSDEGISAEQAAANKKRKEAKKAKNQKRRSRKKVKKQLKNNNACFCCGVVFCPGCNDGTCARERFPLAADVGATCTCQICNFCFIRNFIGSGTRCNHGNWHIPCPGGCGNNYRVPDVVVGWCSRSVMTGLPLSGFLDLTSS